MQVTMIGLDLAKNVFQVPGVDAHERPVLRKRLSRTKVLEFFAQLPPCRVGMEACPGAHWWARQLLQLGHDVKLMPPQYVRPYVKRNKNDAADAEAICEALTRPSMRFVPVKSLDQQAALLLHRTRDLLVAQRTQLANALRGHLAELGVVTAKGIGRVRELVTLLAEANDDRVPPLAREVLMTVVVQLREIEQKITELERQLLGWHRPTRSAGGWQRFPAWDRSRRPRSSRQWAIQRTSDPDGSSRPGSDWSLASVPAAARNGSAASASVAMATSGGCSCMAPERWFAGRRFATRRRPG
jgi:transposase